MNPMDVLGGKPWVPQLGWTLIQFLWQGAVVAAAYAIARGGARNPGARYTLACAALLAIAMAPVVDFLQSAPPETLWTGSAVANTSAAPHSEWSTTPVAVPPASPWADEVAPWFVIAWFSGVAALSLRLVGGWMACARARSLSTRAVSPEWLSTLRQLSARLNVTRPVAMLTSALVDVPTVVGWLRPVILMPVGAFAGLPAEYIEAFLTHELAHIRRHDFAVNAIQRIVETLLFYHPAVWWISREIRNAREECCDDIAVSAMGDAIVYAEALAGLEVSRPGRPSPLAASGGSLEARIARLLGVERQDRQLPCAATPLAAILVLSLAVALPAQREPRPVFEVVSIKPSPPEYVGFQSYVRGDRYTAMTATLRNLMSFAYGIRDFQISGGPAWTSTSAFNVSAKIGAASGPDQTRLMVQAMLTDRFGLKFHRVTKKHAGYALVIDRGGPKLSASAKPGPGLGLGRGQLTGRGADMRTLAGELSSQLEAPIADRTGLKALYDFKLDWSPDLQASEPSEQSVFSAIREQLGLRLDPMKNIPVELFVIDSMHKPTEN